MKRLGEKAKPVVAASPRPDSTAAGRASRGMSKLDDDAEPANDGQTLKRLLLWLVLLLLILAPPLIIVFFLGAL